ncbi:MAG: hypothetical protein U0736_03760 [Gemmataceae bacterium]
MSISIPSFSMQYSYPRRTITPTRMPRTARLPPEARSESNRALWRRSGPGSSMNGGARPTDLLDLVTFDSEERHHETWVKDHRHRLLISGDELQEPQRHTGAMAEAFGLDRKIENYKGTRPITLYRWDLDCLMDVIDLALRDERDYPDRSAPAYLAAQEPRRAAAWEYDAVYGHEQALSAKKAEAEASHGRRSPWARRPRSRTRCTS